MNDTSYYEVWREPEGANRGSIMVWKVPHDLSVLMAVVRAELESSASTPLCIRETIPGK